MGYMMSTFIQGSSKVRLLNNFVLKELEGFGRGGVEGVGADLFDSILSIS